MNSSSLRPYQRAANKRASELCSELEPVLASALRRAALESTGRGDVAAWAEFIKHVSLTQALDLLPEALQASAQSTQGIDLLARGRAAA